MSKEQPDTFEPGWRAALWLALAALLSIFTFGRWVIPLLVWLAPIFLLRFLRTQPVLRGLLLVWFVSSIVHYFVGKGLEPLPDPIRNIISPWRYTPSGL